MMINVDNLYWETYADQTNEDGFKYIGVNADISEITEIDSQVTELKRKYGSGCVIKVYKEN